MLLYYQNGEAAPIQENYEFDQETDSYENCP